MVLMLCFFQKGTYNAEERLVRLKSELVGNASKVNLMNESPLDLFLHSFGMVGKIKHFAYFHDG